MAREAAEPGVAAGRRLAATKLESGEMRSKALTRVTIPAAQEITAVLLVAGRSFSEWCLTLNALQAGRGGRDDADGTCLGERGEFQRHSLR
jgi:hypothetical protein